MSEEKVKVVKVTSLRVKAESVGDVIEVGANGFKKRELIGVQEGEYPQHFKFEFTGDKMDLLNDVMEGMYYTIHYNLRGRKVEAKEKGKDDMYFTSLNGWKVEE